MSESFLGTVHADPWNNHLIDLTSLNARVTDTIEDCVRSVRECAKSRPRELRSESLVFLGPPGAGKTHLFARLRKHLGPRAVFVHIRPLIHAGLTPGFVLHHAVTQLAQPSYGQPQADALVGSLLGYCEAQGVEFPRAHLSAFRELPEDARKEQAERIVDQVLELFPDLDDVFIERLLQVPLAAPRQQRALLSWLSGQDCDPSQLARIDAFQSLRPEHAVRALRTLGSLAALGSPLVLVFDQLENLVQRDQLEERITRYGNLIAELVDSTRGLLIVQMALDSEWEQAIEPQLNLSQRSRVVMKKQVIALPTPNESHALLQLWHEQLDDPAGPLPWPFERQAFDRLLALPGLTPRMLLSSLREAREGSPIGLLSEEPTREETAVETEDTLSREWMIRLDAAHTDLDRHEAQQNAIDEGRFCDGLLIAAEFEPELTLRGTGTAPVQLQTKGDKHVAISFLHHAHHRSVGAALDRLLELPETTRGVIIREQWRALSPTWRGTLAKQAALLARPGIAWHDLTREEAAHFPSPIS